MKAQLAPDQALPVDAPEATLVGRAWHPGVGGPCPVIVRDGDVYDLSAVAETVSELLARPDLRAAVGRQSTLPRLGSVASLLSNSSPDARDERAPWLLAPCDSTLR